MRFRRFLLLVGVLPLTACATARTPIPPGRLAPFAVPAPLPGVARVAPARLVLTVADLDPSYRQDRSANEREYSGAGVTSATQRFSVGTGAGQRHLYDRVGAFAAVGGAIQEFRQEQGDISRSSTALPATGDTLGQQFLAYTVESGSGTTASSSIGVLIQERNYLINLVLSGPHGAESLADLLPVAQRQVAKIATAA